MNNNYKDSDNQLLSPHTIQALQECEENRDTEGFKKLCQSEISKFHLYAKGKTADWNKLVNYIEKNFPGIYPHLVTDALVDFLTQYEFERQLSNGSITLPYSLSNCAKFVLEHENIKAKVAQVIEYDNFLKGYNAKDIRNEILQLKSLAIILFVSRLGIIAKDVWLDLTRWIYIKNASKLDTNGKTRSPFNNLEEVFTFLDALSFNNGNKFPIIDNFWFAFIGRMIIWGIITIVISHFFGGVGILIGIVILLILYIIIFPALRGRKTGYLILLFVNRYETLVKKGIQKEQALEDAFRYFRQLPGIPFTSNLSSEDINKVIKTVSKVEAPDKLIATIILKNNTRDAIQVLKNRDLLKQAVNDISKLDLLDEWGEN